MAKKTKVEQQITKRDLVIKQQALSQMILSKAKINIVTCGHCGAVNLHKIEDEFLICYDCKRKMDVSDCPDLFYNGMENSALYEEKTPKK